MVCIKLTSMECPFEPRCCKTTLIIRSRAFLGIYTFFGMKSILQTYHCITTIIIIITTSSSLSMQYVCVCTLFKPACTSVWCRSAPLASSIFLKLNLPKSVMGKIYLRLAWLLKAQLIQPFLELGLNRVQWMEVFLRCALCMCNRPCCLC